MLSVAIRQKLGDFDLDVAFEGPADGVTMLFGPSGAGKSATLAAIGGASRPAAARVALGERVLTDTATGIAIPPQRRRIGWVYQDARLFPHLPVRANLRYGARRSSTPPRIAFEDVVEVLGIAALLGRRIADLSGGERQRVALGRALLSAPDLLLLDEPLAALDAARKQEILGLIARIKAELKLPMVYVTHSADEVRALADHVVRLEHGRVAAAGTPDTLGFAAAVEYNATVTADGTLAVDGLALTPGERVTLKLERVKGIEPSS